MQKAKMLVGRPLVGFIAFSLLTIISAAITWPGQADRRHAHRTLAAQRQSLPVAVDGSKNPDLIPTHIAYESLLRLLSSGDEGDDKDGKIRESYLRWAGFDLATREELKAAAAEFKQAVSELDQEAAAIKDAKWPRPDAETMAQLAQLQARKEALISGVKGRLFGRITSARAVAVENHLAALKTRTKGYVPELPPATRRVSLLDKLNLFKFTAQAAAPQGAGACQGSMYMSSSTWADHPAGYVHGSGTVTSFYNSCGHSYNQQTYTYHTGYTGSVQATGTNFASIAIDPDPTNEYAPMYDGNFYSSTSSSVYCTHSGWTFGVGGAGSQTFVLKSVKITKVLAQPDEPGVQGPITIFVGVKGSESCGGSDCNPDVTWSLQYNLPPVTFSQGALPHTAAISLDALTHVGTGSHIVGASGNSKKGPVQFLAKIASAPAGVFAATTDVLSNEVCWGGKTGTPPPCPIR